MRFRTVWWTGRESTSSGLPSSEMVLSSEGVESSSSTSTLKPERSFAHACGVDHSKLWLPAVIPINLGREG